MDVNPSLAWCSATGMASGPQDALNCDGYEVARMVERINGGWFAVLRYADGRTIHRDCASLATGMAGCERWAMRHLDALRAQSRRKHLELIACQPWRGDEAAHAMAALGNLASS